MLLLVLLHAFILLFSVCLHGGLSRVVRVCALRAPEACLGMCPCGCASIQQLARTRKFMHFRVHIMRKALIAMYILGVYQSINFYQVSNIVCTRASCLLGKSRHSLGHNSCKSVKPALPSTAPARLPPPLHAPLKPCRLAGEVGLANAPRPGPGSVRVGLLDALHLMGEAEVVAGVKVQEQDSS